MLSVQLPTPATSPFQNEPVLDFADPANQNAVRAAIRLVHDRLNWDYFCSVAGRPAGRPGALVSINPGMPTQAVGRHPVATPEMCDAAIDAAAAAFPSWSRTPLRQRTDLLVRAAALLRQRRLEFCAWLGFEVGKNWEEADAEVAEAIDFLEYYAQTALALGESPAPVQLPGEVNRLLHVPLGIVAVIPPWNFPLAILAGMTMAAAVAGNTVVVKPSPEAPTIAAQFIELLEQCGLPAGVVNLLQGGPEVGRQLTESPRIHAIAFTGSKAVGLRIHEQAARVVAGQRFIKRTILELGGKDGIVVAADADLDLAVRGVVASAFGFSGQKCSACSRVIVENSIYDRFVEQLVAAAGQLSGLDPLGNGKISPVINRAAYDRLLRYIEVGKTEGELLHGGVALTPPQTGYFIAPTIFGRVAPNARLAQEEIFGPLLAVIPVDSLDEALRVANDTEYGLTGALYSSSPDTLQRAQQQFEVGNLYLNRKCTGAMVGAHPFGGFKLSGTDTKTGGPYYLHHFTQIKSVALAR